MLRRLHGTAPVEFTGAAAAITAGELVQAGRTLHGLRGSVGAIGATRFAAAALALETALKQGGADVAALVTGAATALDAVVSALAAWLQVPPP